MPRSGRSRREAAVALVLAVAICVAACSHSADSAGSDDPVDAAAKVTAVPPGPFVRVLGTAQDGGLPHAACDCTRCRAARSQADRRRLIAGLAIVLPESGRVVLVDATPDLREQLDRLRDVRNVPAQGVDRAPVDGVFLTHAHIGHYLGLAFFGFEAIHTRNLPVYSTPSLAEFLRANGPWSQLVEFGNVVPRPLSPGERVEIGDGVLVSAVKVPHRDEYADTVGFLIEGPQRNVFYVPDTDSWDAWEPGLPELLEDVDVALLDGTFYSIDELPGRSIEEIGHPLITDSMELLAAAVVEGGLTVYFTHLNHSNPAVDPGSLESAEIARRGFAVLQEGQEIEL